MEVRIDKFGCVLTPNKIRKVLGLQAGQVLSLYTSAENNFICSQTKIEQEIRLIKYTKANIPNIDQDQRTKWSV